MKIAFIGGGNMATALVSGLLRQDTAPADVHIVEPNEVRRGQLQREFGVSVAAAPDAAIGDAHVVVLAVKPQQMHAACTTLRPCLHGQLIVSIAAGIRAVDLARWLGTQRIVRSMPNTPALIGRGMAGMMALAAVDDTARALAERVLRACGDVVWFASDDQIDAVTAVSGSGPAYVFYFIEALIAAGEALGFDERQSRTLAVGTVIGAAHLAAASAEPISTLRERVTSKGGTTAAALAVLENAGVDASIIQALRAAARRAAELGDEFGRN